MDALFFIGDSMLENLKREVFEIAKKAQKDGLCKHKSGNFSRKDEETGLIAITPAGVDREILTARDIVIIDENAKIIENESNYKPTSECLMHLKIYETRDDARAIAHTHSLYGTTFALLNKAIPALVYEAANLGLTKGRIPVAPYGRPGTQELADSVIDAVKEAECFLLEKHGTVAFDKNNLYEAYLKACYIEELAQLYFNSLSMGIVPEIFSQEELDQWKYPGQVK